MKLARKFLHSVPGTHCSLLCVNSPGLTWLWSSPKWPILQLNRTDPASDPHPKWLILHGTSTHGWKQQDIWGSQLPPKSTKLGNMHFLKQTLMKSEHLKLFMMFLLRNYYSSPKKRFLLKADLSHNKHPQAKNKWASEIPQKQDFYTWVICA